MALQVLSADKLLHLNDFPLMGQVQNFDWAPAFNAEDIFELGRDTKVASALELETSGSFEVLSIGGTAGILARMIMRRNPGTQAFLGYKFDETIVSGTFASGTTTTGTTTGLVASALVGMTLYITGGTAAGESKVITANTTTVITVASAFSTALSVTSVFRVSGGNNFYTFTQSDLRECVFDMIENTKSDQTNWDRSTVLPRCFLTTVGGRADAAGSANETFNFAGDFVVTAPFPYHAIRAIPATRTTASTVTLADITVTGTTHALAYLYVDEKRLRTTVGDGTYASLGAAGLITLTGYTVSATQRLSAIVWDNTAPTQVYPAVASVDRATSSFFTRGYMADVYIAPADPTNPTQNEKWLRVQNIDWSIDMRVDALRQIAYSSAGTSVYARLPQVPFTVSSNVSVFESDLADWKAVLNPTYKAFGATGTDFYNETYDWAPLSMKDSFAVVVQYRTKAGTLLQTWRFTDMRVDGYSQRVNVGGRSEVQWTLKGTAFSLLGVNA